MQPHERTHADHLVEEDERDRERQERIEKKRKQDAEERVKKRDPEAEPDKQTRSFFEHGEDGGIQDDDPYGLPMPPGEKVTRAEQRPQPWDSFELYALMLS